MERWHGPVHDFHKLRIRQAPVDLSAGNLHVENLAEALQILQVALSLEIGLGAAGFHYAIGLHMRDFLIETVQAST